MSKRIQWPVHTREEMESLWAEWDRADGVIEIMPPQNSGFGSGLFIGSVAATAMCLLIFWFIS
jgi:hypothetical protein